MEYLASIAATNCQPLDIPYKGNKNNTSNMRRNSSDTMARRPNIIASSSSTNFYVPSVSSSSDNNYSNSYSYNNNNNNYATSNQNYSNRYRNNNTYASLYNSTETNKDFQSSNSMADNTSMSFVDPNIFTEDQKRTIVNAFRRLSSTSIDIEPIKLEDTSHSAVPPLPVHRKEQEPQQEQQKQQQCKTCQSNRIQRQMFLIFMYILFKVLDEETKTEDSTIDSSSSPFNKSKIIKAKARQAVKECTHGLRLGIKGYSPIMDAVINKLQLIEGIDKSWQKADRYLKSYWKTYSKKVMMRADMVTQKRRRDDGVVIRGESIVGKFDAYNDGCDQKRHKGQSYIAQV